MPMPPAILTPERLSDEHRLIGQAADEFIDNEVVPVLDRLEAKDWALARALMKRCGELGLLGTDVPEAFGGVELDKAASVLVGEAVGPLRVVRHDLRRADRPGRSPRSSASAPTSRSSGTCPGSSAASWSAPTRSASRAPDRTRSAQGARRPAGDGSFVAQRREDVDHQRRLRRSVHRLRQGDRRRRRPAVHRVPGRARLPRRQCGKEEHKMGLHGSSTTPLILQDARVPPENVLGEVGKGHKVAFNVLNYGRFKLAAMCSGGARRGHRRGGGVRGRAQAVRAADRQLRRDPAQARRDGDPRVRRRGDALPDRRPDRRRDRRLERPAPRCWPRSRSSRSRRRS